MEPAGKIGERLATGRRLSRPPSGEEVVISGIAGCFPDSDSVLHLQENLFNKVDLISDDDRRWKLIHPEIPQRTGKINHITKFDADFFGVHYKEAHTMDPMGRIMLEKTYEAVVDAGMNPTELRNKKVGVFVGACVSETEKVWAYDKMNTHNFGVIGCSKSMLANRLSGWLGVTGPSYAADTACSSSLTAMDHAFRAIRNGLCDSAIVGGSNLVLHPFVSLQFFKLGVLSFDGRCKSFDNSGNGYVRSEAIVVCFLQKAQDSRRAYAQLVYTKTNSDGFKEHGISYPSRHMQKVLMQEFYEECSVPQASIEFVEAHATGTKAGDPEELKAIDEVFCTGRDQPLLVGSIKSNLGHSEPAAGLCSLAKMCVAYSSGYIPPNINYHTPREGVEALASGRVQVVVEKQPWNRGPSAINSFGFGGANVHVLLKNFARVKVNNGLPLDSLPRLVCVSGRTESAVARILDDLESRPLDAEQVRLWHAVHERDVPGHAARGYTLLRSYEANSAPSHAQSIARSISCCAGARCPLWFVYSGVPAQWLVSAAQLMEIPMFATAIETYDKALAPVNLNLPKLITDATSCAPLSVAHASAAVAAVQVALTDLLKAVGIEPDHAIGHGVGELVCAYADGRLSAKQTVLASYKRGCACAEPPRVNKAMTTVKFGYDQSHDSFEKAARLIPSTAVIVEVAPHAQLRDVLARCRSKHAGHVALMQQGRGDSIQALLTGLGKLYEAGWNPRIAGLYPHVQFPVSTGTPMLAHLVEWEHSEDWFVETYKDNTTKIHKSNERTVKISTAEGSNYEFLTGHVVDGRNLIPATGYLVMVWETFGMRMGKLFTQMSVVFENIRFQRATSIPKDGDLEFIISIQKSGYFEIMESGTPIVTGRIFAKNDVGRNYRALPKPRDAVGAGAQYLTARDFYKELRLRGYQYRDLFRGVIGCNMAGTHGRLAWVYNWETFMDCMLQLRVISIDTRALLVPTRIGRLSIDVAIHYDVIESLDPKLPQQSLEIRIYPDVDIIRSGGIEICGVFASSITRRVPRGEPVLEGHLFVPNFGKNKMKMNEVIRVNVQLILENLQLYKMKSIELVDEEYTKHGYKPVIEEVGEILGNMPLMQAELLVISEQVVDMPPHVTVENKNISSETNTTLFIAANMLSRLDQITSSLEEKGFVISRETEHPNSKVFDDKYEIVTLYDTGCEYVVLLRKKVSAKEAKFIQLTSADETFSWIEPLKEELQNGHRVVVYAQDEENINGVLGLVNCLRKEPGGETVRGFLIADQSAPPFNSEMEFYAKQIEKDLVQNVFHDGQWGTYRYLNFDDPGTVQTEHAYVSIPTIGDLSSLKWVEGPLKHDSVIKDRNEVLLHVYYAALNFHDVMTATGRLLIDTVALGRLEQECSLGLEVVGRTKNGSRVMGIVSNGITNLLQVPTSLLWPIPDEWTFEEAATVPVVYMTVYQALVTVGRMRAGQTVLIHAGSGGVGQAAISLALHFGCEVFTTVGTAEKRAFIKKLFPALKDSHIGNSRDTSFEDMINRETNGRGVDMVLNSLSDEKLHASVRSLANGGKFLEIGMFDIYNNTPVNMLLTSKEVSFHGITLENVKNWDTKSKKRLHDLLLGGIASGAVRPLTHCSFQEHEVEAAFRFMAAGKHVGKLLIKIRDEESNHETVKPAGILIAATPRYMCCDEMVYVVVGGLGGFGLELADWLVLRGARRLLLASRRPVASGYQAARLRAWASYGVRVQVCTHDAASESGCEAMLRAALAMGPVRAVFNLAVVLKDSIFQNQTPEMFRESFVPKALVTINLDILTRKLCPELKDFVVFSSVSCGRGNPGQSNYGYSNSVMERVCERRRRHGLPALAVQWGAVGDVGVVAEKNENIEMKISGTLQQTISSCLLTLDKFLNQDAVIVSSVVVAEKTVGGAGCSSPVEAIAKIMGIKDLKTVSFQTSLADMGLDSMMAVEIKQTLEREFEIFLTAQDIRTLTFNKLVELSPTRGEKPTSVSDDASILRALVGNIGSEQQICLPYIYMPTMVSDGEESEKDEEYPTIFMLPGTESAASSLKPLCLGLKCRACVLQLGVEHPGEDMDAMVSRLFHTVQALLKPGVPFTLLGYSFGCQLVLSLAARLESAGHENGLVFCVDGSVDYNRGLINSIFGHPEDPQTQNLLITRVINVVAPKKNIVFSAVMKELSKLESFEDKVKYAVDQSSAHDTEYSSEFISQLTRVLYDRIKVTFNVNAEDVKKIQAPIVLVRTKEILPTVACSQNYGLDVFTHGTVTVHCVEGNHFTILEKEDCVNIINEGITSKRGILS